MKKLFVIPLTIMVMSALILGGCAKPVPAPTPAEPIRIGVLYPLTGPLTVIGELMVRGAMFGFEEAGYEVAGRTIEVIVEDSGSEVAVALDKAKKLVEYDKVAMITGPLITSSRLAVGTYMSEMGVPHLAAHPSPLKMTECEWSFMVGGSEPQLCHTMGVYAYDEMGLRTVTAIAVDAADGRGFLGAFMDAFKKRGGQVIQEQYPPFNCPDYAPYLVNLKDADAIAAWFKGADVIRFVTQFHEFGIRERMPMVGAFFGGFLALSLVRATPPEAADARIGEPCPGTYTALLETDVNKRFVDAFEKKYGYTPEDPEEGSYVGAQLALRALKATAGDTTPDKLRQAILALEFEAPEGPIRFEPETRFVVKDVYIIELDKIGGEYVQVPVYTYKDVPAEGL